MENELRPKADSGANPSEEDPKSYFRREPPPETVAHTASELNYKWARYVLPYVRPILEANRKGELEPVASTVLVSLLKKHFLLTAHHVIAEPPLGQLYGAYYTFLPEQLQINGRPAVAALDPHDIALVEIPPPRHSLRLPRHLALDVREGERCLLFGYQAREKCWEFDRVRHTVRPRPLSYLGVVAGTAEGHFTLRLTRAQLKRDGKDVGKLNGISGGGVFVLRDDAPRLAGILIEYHQNTEELKCTNSTAVWSLATQI